MNNLNNKKLASAIMVVGVLLFMKKKRRKRRMRTKSYLNEEAAETVSKITKSVEAERGKMTDAAIAEFTQRIKAMSDAEMELLVELLPVDICMRRIQKELDKGKEFESVIKNAMAKLG